MEVLAGLVSRHDTPPSQIASPNFGHSSAKSVRHFKDQIIRCTRRNVPLTTAELIAEINPIIRGWGLYYCKAHVRSLFKQLKGWIVRRIWSHRFKRWRNAGWRHLPERKLHGELGLVNLVRLIPTLSPR